MLVLQASVMPQSQLVRLEDAFHQCIVFPTCCNCISGNRLQNLHFAGEHLDVVWMRIDLRADLLTKAHSFKPGKTKPMDGNNSNMASPNRSRQ